MAAKIISISKHRRYEHAHLTIYKKWIESRRRADYKSRDWALEPVRAASENFPSPISNYYYNDLVDAYRTKLEIDSVIAKAEGKTLKNPQIFSNDILRRCKLLDEAIARSFAVRKSDSE